MLGSCHRRSENGKNEVRNGGSCLFQGFHKRITRIKETGIGFLKWLTYEAQKRVLEMLGKEKQDYCKQSIENFASGTRRNEQSKNDYSYTKIRKTQEKALKW